MARKILGLPPKFGAQKHHIFDYFCDFCTRHRIYLQNEKSHRQTKKLVSIYNVSHKRWPTFGDLWPRNGWEPMAHCDPLYENSAFSVITRLPTQGPLNPGQPNLFCYMLDGLRGLLSTVKSLRKFVPKNAPAAQPKWIFLANTLFSTSALDTAYLWNETSHRQDKILVSTYNVSPKIWPTFRELWPRNGWHPLAHCAPPFGGHYVGTIIVATCLVFSVSVRCARLGWSSRQLSSARKHTVSNRIVSYRDAG